MRAPARHVVRVFACYKVHDVWLRSFFLGLVMYRHPTDHVMLNFTNHPALPVLHVQIINCVTRLFCLLKLENVFVLDCLIVKSSIVRIYCVLLMRPTFNLKNFFTVVFKLVVRKYELTRYK